MTSLNDLQKSAAMARKTRDAARATVRGNALRLHTIQAALATARRNQEHDDRRQELIAQLEQECRDLEQSIPETKSRLISSRDRAVREIGNLLRDPTLIVNQLDDSLPFLLFPVRIETKFATSQAGSVLKVRIFPDDIAIAHHEKDLTVGENDAGKSYWRSRALSNSESDPDERENEQRGAWNLLASRYGAYRASWIKLSTQPTNWSDDVTDPEALDFPDVPTKPLSWTDSPRSPVMPDMFAVILEQGNTSRTVFGKTIPDDLPLGPDPLQTEGFLTRDSGGRLNISDDLKWLIDFDRAEALGMAVRIPITSEEAASGFTRILVLGLRLSSNAADSATLLTRLFESHRFSQGMSILPQGTPTNNTNDAKSGMTTPSESVDETYDLEHDSSPFPISSDPMHQTDGQRLATALGLPIDTIRSLPNARGMDIAESVAMNRALWPATLGNFNKELLQGTFAPLDVSRVQSFFTQFVHGRGLAPAIRVGSEPYGLLFTSSFDDWAWSDFEHGQEGDFWDRLQTELLALRKQWMAASLQVRFVGNVDVKGNPLNPFETLLNIIGLQATSVEYWSRTGVPDSYLKALAAYRNNDPDLVKNWIGNAKNDRVLALSKANLRLGADARLKSILFLDSADLITPPIVDGDPTIPLSETDLVRPYNGIAGNNYIYWLATASSSDLQAEKFLGSDGKPVNAPDALLYKMLRVATVAELDAASRNFANRMRPDVFASAPQLRDIVNVDSQDLLPGHYTLIDTARMGVPSATVPLGDYLLGHARAPSALLEKPPEAAPLATLTDALKFLANLPTARLERLLAEHVDAVSYRLDAWLTAIFGRRMEIQRSRQRAADGIYIGAYGWVEKITPAKDRLYVAPDTIPKELKPAVEGPVVTYAGNGGFVLAPSLPHAVTAAVIRSAYLTHATSADAKIMSVNLSSNRVRTALSYIEGLQNGQDLGSLLGYQLERGLHEGHPGIELDQFIYVLREKFPLVSNKVTPVKDGVPADVIEARNVVNGYDLLDFVKDQSYPYGISGLPNAAGSATEKSQAEAIQQEVDAIHNAMDSVADLLLTESLHQVVQGNYARARGAIQALSEGELAPIPDVVQTPRSGKSLTHRVAVVFDPSATAGWNARSTARANANAMLNHWLRSLLPAAADIEYTAKLGDAAPEFLNLASSNLEPLDVVIMCGERIGDLSSSLERLLVQDFRTTRNVGDDIATFFFKKDNDLIRDDHALVFDPDQANPGKYSLSSLMPLLKALRRIVTQSRPLNARDLMRPTEAQNAHPENPNGNEGSTLPLKDLGELKTRLEDAYSGLSAEQAALQTLVTTMQPLADALANDENLAIQPAWAALLAQLNQQLRSIFLYGVPEALPVPNSAVTRTRITGDFSQAQSVHLLVAARLAQARKLLDIAFPDPLPTDAADASREMGRRVTARMNAYAEAARQLLGPEFVIIPLFAPHSETVSELSAATAAPVETDSLAVESWLQALSHVRTPIQAIDSIANYRDWIAGDLLRFVPVQLPREPGAKWIGGKFEDTVAADDVLSAALLNPPTNYNKAFAGLLVDEWTELVPADHETVGLALNANRPNAVAPQALLLAIAPKQLGSWSWSDLVAILHDTMARARLRAVEPDLIKYPYVQLLPPIVTPFNRSMLIAAATLATASKFAIGAS